MAISSLRGPRWVAAWGTVGAAPVRAVRGLAIRHRGSATLVAVIVSAVALWWLLSDPVLAAFAAAMRRAQLWQLAAAWALVPVIQGLRAWRFSLLATGRLADWSWSMYAIASRLLLFNYVLPFKLGEVSFPLMMKRAFGTDYVRSAGVLIMARLLDLCVVVALFLVGVVLVVDPAIHSWDLPILLAAGIGALALPVVGVHLLAPLWRASGRLRRLAPWIDRLLWRAVVHHPLPQRTLALALTLAIWLTHTTLAWLAATAVAGGLDFFQIMLASAAANLAFAMPISGLAGVGPPQAAWAAALYVTDVAWPPAIVTALLCHGVLLTGALILGAATFLAPTRRPTLSRPMPGP